MTQLAFVYRDALCAHIVRGFRGHVHRLIVHVMKHMNSVLRMQTFTVKPHQPLPAIGMQCQAKRECQFW